MAFEKGRYMRRKMSNLKEMTNDKVYFLML